MKQKVHGKLCVCNGLDFPSGLVLVSSTGIAIQFLEHFTSAYDTIALSDE